MPRYLTADEAADELGITKNTLYAYVSRGLIRSEPHTPQRRTRRYRADDVRRLQRKKKLRQDPATAAETALDFGLPVMESALTLIDGGQLYYRGRDACQLAQTHTLEAVATLLWDTESPVSMDDIDHPPDPFLSREAIGASPTARMQAILPAAEAADDRAYDLSKRGIVRTGQRLLTLFTALATVSHPDPPGEGPMHQRLTRAWQVEAAGGPDLIQAALVLCADHGLNVTAFAARCVASAETTPYGAVNAALAALGGRKHAGRTARIEALLREAGSPEQFRSTVTRRLQRGDAVPGFGHRLYPSGDPRAALILDQLNTHAPDAEGTAFAREAAEVGRDVLGQTPAIDFSLVLLAWALNLPAGAPLTLFALGRTVGWMGHLLEQYARDQVIRPRARYVGPAPKAP